jgi:hypothetical protein
MINQRTIFMRKNTEKKSTFITCFIPLIHARSTFQMISTLIAFPSIMIEVHQEDEQYTIISIFFKFHGFLSDFGLTFQYNIWFQSN